MAQTKIKLETNKGDIIILLDEKNAPISSKNFIEYVESKYYDGIIFHRVIKNFMIQGGGMDQDFNQQKTKASIKNEADNGLKNDLMTIAMARTSDVNSATSQFFINLTNNDFLNHGSRDFGYAVFGKVVEGQDIVKSIGEVDTESKHGHADVPKDHITILKASVHK